ncbi:Tad domain-containing protein [bacterium]|nr:Tad domain-containing protein [bacterium]
MKSRFFFFPLRKRGSVIIMSAAASIFFLGLVAMVTDVGWMYYNRNKLQTAVNAGWKAGYDQMSQIMASSSTALTSSQQDQVRTRVRAVMQQNGYSSSQVSDVAINFGSDNSFTVTSRQSVDLFFAKAIGFNSVNISAGRTDLDIASGTGGGSSGGPAAIIPLAIPHGVVKDLTRNTYDVSFFNGSQEFAANQEYILKLGSGGGSGPASGPTEDPDMKKILVPMDQGAQPSDAAYMKAYGAAYWCLKINDSDTGYTPVEWLLGYRGGSFFLPYDQAVIDKLTAMGVSFTIITGSNSIQAIYDLVNPNVLEMYNRPKIAVYSSQTAPDPVETVLRAAEIPYGTYMPTRTSSFNSALCTHIYDGEIIDNVLSGYNWLHTHHEDFTGWTGGCKYLNYTCKTWVANIGGLNRTSYTNNDLCNYCRGRITNWTTKTWSSSYSNNSCTNYGLRCAERSSWDGRRYWDFMTTGICQQGDDERPMCRSFKTSYNLATTKGFTDSTGYSLTRKWVNSAGSVVTGNGSVTLPADNGFVRNPNRVQRMKWAVVNKIREHISLGGFLYAQCFALETLDISLWHSKIFTDNPMNVTNPQAFENCLAFTGFVNKGFCKYEGNMYYTNINGNYNGAFTTNAPLDPRCQNHTGASPSNGGGHTDSMTMSVIKNSTTVLGTLNSYSSIANYVKGTVGTGEFCFAGGHSHQNIQSKRLVLNNVLLGSLSTKVVQGGGPEASGPGRQKNNYGPIDPDNVNAGGANDYRDRFKYGFRSPLQISDRIMPEPGNMSGPTDQAVDFHVNGALPVLPSRRVIVPITDVPPEVPTNNRLNASATSVYDLQGQDHPNGVYASSSYAFGSSIRIIGFAEFELIPVSEYTRNGTSVSSGDSGDLGPYQSGQVRGKFIRYIVKPGEITIN